MRRSHASVLRDVNRIGTSLHTLSAAAESQQTVVEPASWNSGSHSRQKNLNET